MTVTAPLDMGTGQQRYVVAYTLKQGIEKQPDILNAQKSMHNFKHFLLYFTRYSSLKVEFVLFSNHFIHCYFSSSSHFMTRKNPLSLGKSGSYSGSESTHSFKAAQVATTPPLSRPDALYLSKSNYSPNANFVSIHRAINFIFTQNVQTK